MSHEAGIRSCTIAACITRQCDIELAGGETHDRVATPGDSSYDGGQALKLDIEAELPPS